MNWGTETLPGNRDGQRGKVTGEGQGETWKLEPGTRNRRLKLENGNTSAKRERPRGNLEARPKNGTLLGNGTGEPEQPQVASGEWTGAGKTDLKNG
jgi:hypothetical protein